MGWQGEVANTPCGKSVRFGAGRSIRVRPILTAGLDDGLAMKTPAGRKQMSSANSRTSREETTWKQRHVQRYHGPAVKMPAIYDMRRGVGSGSAA